MKRIISVLFLSVLFSTMYADHSYTGDNWNGPYDPNMYVGNERYRYMVGGLYDKGNVHGIVYFIDNEGKYMKVSIPSPSVIYDTFFVTYDKAVEIYEHSLFNMITLDEVILYQKNRQTVKYNRTWEWIHGKRCIITSRMIWTSTKGEHGDVVACGLTSDNEIIYYEHSTEHKYLAAHWGSIDVPFEPEYVSEYVGYPN